MIEKLLGLLKEKIKQIIKELGVNEEVEIMFEVPKEEGHGDYSTNIAMRLARALHKAPIMIANDIISRIDKEEYHLENIEVAGAGFINLYIDKKYLAGVVFKVLEEKEMGQRDLAYEINKHKTGYYFLLVTEAPVEAINEFNRISNISDTVIRTLITNIEN